MLKLAGILDEEDLRGQVVGIAVEPSAAGRGAFGCTLVFTFGLQEVVAREDGVGQQMQPRFVFVLEQVAGENDLVEEIPFATVVEGAYTLFVEHVVPGVVEIVGGTGVFVTLGREGVGRGDGEVAGVVVEVAHDDNACIWVLLEEGFLEAAHLVAGTLTHRALCAARRPVVDDEIELFVPQIAFDGEETAGDVGGVAAQETVLVGIAFDTAFLVDVETEIHVGLAFGGVDVRDELGFDEVEGFGIVEQRHVDAAAVGAVEVDVAITASGQGGFAQEIVERVAVFDLAQTDDGGAGGVLLRTHFGTKFTQHLGDVVELGGVFLFCPLVGAGGQELVVVLAGVVLRVEKVFDVVKSHAVEHLLLC